MNNFSGIGRVGRDAETRHTAGGTTVTSWPVAIDSGYGQNKKTEWFDCALWGERGEKLASYIRKGDRIGLQGEVSLDTYQTKDGSEKSRLRLRVVDVTLLGNKDDGHSGGHERQQSRAAPAKRTGTGPVEHRDDFQDDDIPFISNRGAF